MGLVCCCVFTCVGLVCCDVSTCVGLVCCSVSTCVGLVCCDVSTCVGLVCCGVSTCVGLVCCDVSTCLRAMTPVVRLMSKLLYYCGFSMREKKCNSIHCLVELYSLVYRHLNIFICL